MKDFRSKANLTVLTMIAWLIAAPVGQATDIVVNGNFEADFPAAETSPIDWTLINAISGSDFFVGSMPTFGAHSLPDSSNFGATGNTDDVLSQVLSTVLGQIYTLDFFLSHDDTNALNDFHVLWNGAPVLNLVNAGSFGWTEYAIPVVATGSSTTLTFQGRDVPAWYGLDDVSVSIGLIPEPGSMLLLCTGLVGLTGYRCRRRS